MRVLSVQGGSLGGALQLRTLLHLAGLNGKGTIRLRDLPEPEEVWSGQKPYDRVLGVSVGALNGSMFSCAKFKELWRLWDEIDDDRSMNGVKGVFERDVMGREGYFNLDPVRAKLEKHVSLAELKIPFTCGVTVERTFDWKVLHSKDMRKDIRLIKSILGSAAIAAAIEGQEMMIDGAKEWVHDGGHRHTFCPLPAGTTEADVVLCNPYDWDGKWKHKKGIPNKIAWLAACADRDRHKDDVEELERMASRGVKIRVWSPPEPYGSLLDGSRETILWRRDTLGAQMLEAGPRVLG